MSEKMFQPGQHHPEEWQEDLNPNESAGQNSGVMASQQEKEAPTAHDMKEVMDAFPDFTSDELKQIPILPPGTRLQQGATYIDIHAPSARPFKARGDQEAQEYNWYVPKSEVDYVLWNKLTGVDTPARLDEEDEE